MPSKPPIGRRFKPGQSGNPTGRPKDQLARLILDATGGGQVMVDFWVAVVKADEREDGPLKGRVPNLTHMHLAAEKLADWSHLKPAVQVEASGVDAQPLVVQVVKLADAPEEPKT